MFVKPAGKLRELLEQHGHHHLLCGFDVDETVNDHIDESHRVHGELDDEHHGAVALYAYALKKYPPKHLEKKPADSTHITHTIQWLKIVAALLLLLVILLGARFAHAAGGGVPAQPGVIVEGSNNGSILIIRPHGLFQIDCGSGMSCSATGNKFTVTSTGTGGTVFYQTLQNATTGLTQRSVLNFQNGITCSDNAGASRTDCQLTIPITGTPDIGKIPIGQGDGTAAFADPLVQGTQADGSTTEPNPVLNGVWDGTNLRALKGDSTNGAWVNVKAIVGITFASPQHVIPDSLPALASGSNTIGNVKVTDGTNFMPTGDSAARSIHFTLDNSSVAVTGTFWQSTQPVSCASGATCPTNATLQAGSAIVGKVGLDSTTPGNTNGVTMYQPSRLTGTITTASSTVSVAATGYGVATVTVNGTYAGVTANFEFSDDGSNWYAETCTRSDTNVQESSPVLPSNQSRAWDCSVYAATNFRVRSSAWTSGTANIGITLSGAPVEAAPTVSVSGTVPVSGTFFQATQPVSCASGATCPVNATLQTGANTIGAVTQGAGSGALGTYWYNRETDGTNAVVLDPCRTNANSFARISQTANTQVITGVSAKKIYICSINLVTAAANNVALVEGTGTVCATSIAGVSTGGTTAATGWNLGANGGLTEGSGLGSVMATATNADNLCILQSAAVQLSGVIGYVTQ